MSTLQVDNLVTTDRTVNISLKSLSERFVTSKDLKSDFGAIGDGKTDDTKAIQNAITWAASESHGGKIYVPPGSYSLSSALKFDGGNAQVFLEGVNSGAAVFSWSSSASSHGILGGITTPISRFQIKGVTLVTNIVNSTAAVKIIFNHTSPKSFYADDIQCYGAAVGGTPSAGYFAGGMFDLTDPVYPIISNTMFNGMGGDGINISNNNLINAGINITSKNAAVLITNIDNCNVTGASAGLRLNSQSNPGIEGTFIRNSNFGFVNAGIVADASGSGTSAYYPPQIFIHNSQIEYYQVGVSINHHSVVDISDTLIYTDGSVTSASSHVILNNCNDSRVHSCHMESRPANTSVSGVIAMGASSYVEVYDNQIKVPSASAAVIFSDTASYCRQRNNTVKGGSEYVNSSSNASTNTSVFYQQNGEISFPIERGYVVKKGSKTVTLGTSGTFTITFEASYNTENITTLAVNGDSASGTNSVVLTSRTTSGFTGYFVGGSSGSTARINFDSIGN